MTEYIERETAIGMAISGRIRALPTTEDGEDWIRVEEVRESLQSIPAADVEPVRHGHWTGTEYDGYADGNPVYTLFECSECGVEYEQEEHYCPWCGAKMDG